MANTGARTAEAKALNAGVDHFKTMAEVATERGERMEMAQLMPDGMVLDQEMLDLVVREEQTWAPLRRARQRLVELGARGAAAAVIMDPADVEALRARVRAERS